MDDIVLPRLSVVDRLLRVTVLPLIPRWIRPNYLTVLRMLATPFIVIILLQGNYRLGIPVFLFIAFTDALDGALARTRHQITEWGKIYDPLADKFLIGSVVIVVVMRELGFFLGAVILALEVMFIVTAWWRLRMGRAAYANIWGKIKMNLQVAGVTLLLLGLMTAWPPFFPISQATFTLAILFALVSLLTYGI